MLTRTAPFPARIFASSNAGAAFGSPYPQCLSEGLRRERRARVAPGEFQSRDPLGERAERHISEAALEEHQERNRKPLTTLGGDEDEVAEVDGERQFNEGQQRFERNVLRAFPGLRSSLDAVLRSAREF